MDPETGQNHVNDIQRVCNGCSSSEHWIQSGAPPELVRVFKEEKVPWELRFCALMSIRAVSVVSFWPLTSGCEVVNTESVAELGSGSIYLSQSEPLIGGSMMFNGLLCLR